MLAWTVLYDYYSLVTILIIAQKITVGLNLLFGIPGADTILNVRGTLSALPGCG